MYVPAEVCLVVEGQPYQNRSVQTQAAEANDQSEEKAKDKDLKYTK